MLCAVGGRKRTGGRVMEVEVRSVGSKKNLVKRMYSNEYSMP